VRIVVGNDHAGFGLRDRVFTYLAALGVDATDVGTDSAEPVDFPLVTQQVTQRVLDGTADRGILVCGTGVGACIAANKVPGIRAAVCHDTHVARQSVEHDDVNVLCIGAWIVGPLIAEDVISAFLDAHFGTGDDVRRRVQQLRELEERYAGGDAHRPGD
jgi:ribose 5-phosphate isomerase B